MEFLAFLLVLALIIGLFKVLGVVFKAAFLLISIPLQILGALIVAALVFALLPVTGLLTLILIPLGLLAPLLPIILIAAGIYMLVRR